MYIPILALSLLSPWSSAQSPAVSTPAPADQIHPIITEVLYAVPTYEGDANLDGTRSATGDEFVEIMNQSDSPIQLRGYTLTDRNAEGQGRFRFRFPDLELAPGELAVVFNGYQCKWVGPVGDDRRAPPAKHDLFHDAWVFTARSDSSLTALANDGDWILLSSPAGTPIQCVRWGRMGEYPPMPEDEIDQAPTIYSQSVVRGPDGRFGEHSRLFGPLRYSPGEHQRATSDPRQHGSP